jgi:peptidoglycan/LPS O-acetylase OafA/YrhL
MIDQLKQRRGFTNFIRLAAAIAVLASHSYPISGSGPDPEINNIPLGEFAVSVFFVLSGFFIYSSSLSHSVFDYLVLRAARLFPALIFFNLIFAFFMAPFVRGSIGSLQDWFGLDGSVNYVFRNSTLIFGLQSNIGNLFSSLPYSNVVNGSLWTLPTELRCYLLCVVVAILAKRFNSQIPIFLCFSIFTIVYLARLFGVLDLSVFIHFESLKLFLIFFSGSLISRFRLSREIPWFLWMIFLFLYLSIVFLVPRDVSPFLYWGLLLLISNTPLQLSRLFNYFSSRDYSYGFYLWAFPVSQLVMKIWPSTSAPILISMGILITLIFALVSWNVVEKPLLDFARGFINGR